MRERLRAYDYRVRFLQDVERAGKIAKVLYDQFSTRSGFFKNYEMPEYIPPAGISKQSKEYALYLTYVIAIDFQTDAVKLWKRSRELYERESSFFDPKVRVASDQTTLRHIVRSLGSRYPNGAATGWKKISQILLDKYGGDPRNITPNPMKLSEVRARISEFPYLRGKKLNNFYLRAMGENQLLKIEDLENLGVAVDIQVARITFYTGVLKVDGAFSGCIHNQPVRPMIEDMWSKAANATGIPPWYIDEPLWSLGSKLCSRRECYRCPVQALCEKCFTVTFKGANVQVE